ncbi:hypothetical protein TNCV_1147651 [Trichonephila clavipes]|nr:hypothetical protein TNCV_1147651 [Trichonephila clavipes]
MYPMKKNFDSTDFTSSQPPFLKLHHDDFSRQGSAEAPVVYETMSVRRCGFYSSSPSVLPGHLAYPCRELKGDAGRSMAVNS